MVNRKCGISAPSSHHRRLRRRRRHHHQKPKIAMQIFKIHLNLSIRAFFLQFSKCEGAKRQALNRI